MKHRSENGSRFDGWPLEKDASGTRAPSDLAGLRNQVRLIRREAEAGNVAEVRLQLDALLDDLSNDRVAFDWRGGATAQARMTAAATIARAEDEEEHRAGVAAFAADNPGMVD